MIEKIIKRDGRVVSFDKTKIAEAIWKAAQSVGGKDKGLAYKLADQVVELLEKTLKPGEIPTVEQVQDLVEKVLVENGHYKTAKAYITYRKYKEQIRKEKIALLGKFYEEQVAKKFSVNALRLMVNRYLLKDEKGNLIEGPKQMFERVAMLIVIPDILYDEEIFDKEGKQERKPQEDFDLEKWDRKVGLGKKVDGYEVYWNKYHLERMKKLYDELNAQGKMKVSWSEFWNLLLQGKFEKYFEKFKEYFNLMISKKFLPNSPTLFNAGARLGQLSACFVLPIEDNMESIMDAAKYAALIFKSGGGIGINFSKLRPEGDIVASTAGVASGPVSFMRIIDVVTDVVKQGGCIATDTYLRTDLGLIKPTQINFPTLKDEFILPFSVFSGERFENAFLGSLNGKSEVFRIETEIGNWIEVTYNELVATLNQNCEITFKRAIELKENDWIVISLNGVGGKEIKLPKIRAQHFNSNRLKIPSKLNEDFAEILGYYMADGCFNRGRLILTFNNEKLKKYFVKKIRKTFGLKVGEIRKKETYEDVVWFSRDLERYFERLGLKKETSTRAFVPDLILQAKEKVIRAFLRGLFEGDGSVSSYGYPYLVSTSPTLIHQVQQLLFSLGIVSKIGKIEAKKIKNHKGKKDLYHLRIVDSFSLRKFIEKIGFISEEKNERILKNKKFEFNWIIPYSQSKLKKVYKKLKMENPKRASRFYRKLHKYMLGKRNLTLFRLKILSEEFEELKKEFEEILEGKYYFVKISSIQKKRKETFHLEVSPSGKFVANGILLHNKRRGANMGILESWHPDIFKFIHAKEKEGQFENFNISVMLDKKFWEALKKNEKYELINPRTKEVVATVDPKKLFKEIAKVAWKTADPGVLFLDNMNLRNVQKESRGLIRATNPCITGSTRVLTPFGLIKAKTLYNLLSSKFSPSLISKQENCLGYETEVILSEKKKVEYRTAHGKKLYLEIPQATKAYIWKIGFKPVYKVKLENGLELEATPNHLLLTKNGWKKVADVENEEIKISRIDVEKIKNYGISSWNGLKLDWKLGFLIGWLVGDGYVTENKATFYFNLKKELYVAKFINRILKEKFGYEGKMFERKESNTLWLYISRKEIVKLLRILLRTEEKIPEIVFLANVDFVKGFLNGLFSADGYVDKDGAIRLTSSELNLLKEVQLILLLFGIFSKIYSRPYSRKFVYLTKDGKKKEYKTKGYYELIIKNYSRKIFAKKIGLIKHKQEKLMKKLKKTKIDKEFCKVVSVEYEGEKIVYDFTVPNFNFYISNGVISHNCGEQPLYPFESCNLGSINLYAFVKRENGKKYFNWDEFKETIKIAYEFLDNVIDVNKYPIEQIEKASKNVRRIGLGFMGLADTLFALEIPYNSEEGFEFIRKVCEWLTYYAMFASIERAKERGVFPLYEKTSYPKGEMPIEGFYHKELWSLDWEKLKNEILKNGIRNVEVTSIAPTGSISMLLDVSAGIEPQFSLVYEKRVVAGNFFYIDVEFEQKLKEIGLHNDEILKKISENGGSVQGLEEIPLEVRKVFVTALDIPWWDHVRAQALAQLWITTSISKTINMPEWVEEEDIEKAYLLAHELGCKGITIYREKSKSVQVIYLPGEISKKRIEETVKLIKNHTISIMKKFGIDPPKWYVEILKNGKIISATPKNFEGPTEKCPVCESTNLIHQAGCIICKDCGWSACLVA